MILGCVAVDRYALNAFAARFALYYLNGLQCVI